MPDMSAAQPDHSCDDSDETHVEVINLVSPGRRPRVVKATAELQIVCESLRYMDTPDRSCKRRRRTPLREVHANQAVVTNFEERVSDKDVRLVQHVEVCDPLKHYAHPRPACNTFRFRDDKRKFCGKSFCVICDVPASQCKSWHSHCKLEI